MDIITNKPAKAPLIELFPNNSITVRLSFPNGYTMSGLEAKIYRKLDNTIISDVSKQPEILIEDQLLSIIFTSDKIKLLSSPFILYIYDNDAAIISFDCITSNKSGDYQDITTQVVIGDETIVVVNAQLNPASSWGSIQGDITLQEDLIQYISDNGLSQSEADLLYANIVHTHTFASLTSKPTTLIGYGITDSYPLTGNPSNFLTSINSSQVINALGYTPVSLSGSYADPSWITSLSKSKVGLSNVLNIVQEPVITSGTTAQYWRGDKTWVAFPTIPTNNNQLTNGSNYITASSADVLTNKTGNISQWTNNSGYLTSASLTGYATESFVSSGYSPLGHTHTFASLTSKPTTLSGYGITDAYTKTEIDGFSFTTASNTQTFTNKSGNISQWTNNSGYLTGINSSQVTTALGYTPVNPNGTNVQYIAGDGSKITFPSIPTDNNQITNGSGYITASSSDTLTNKSISYSQLTGTPSIPTNANYVDKSTNQTTLAGTKDWTALHTFGASITVTGTFKNTNGGAVIQTSNVRGADVLSLHDNTTPTTTNYFLSNGSSEGLLLNHASVLQLRIAGVSKLNVSATQLTSSVPIVSTSYKLSALNTAPASAIATGTLGDIRWVDSFVYLCVSTNSWQRAALASW